MKNVFFLSILMLTACASVPQAWHKADGTSQNVNQLALDQATCQGEMKRANLNRTLKPLIETIVSPPEQELVGVYNGCMAQRGWLPNQ